MAMIHPVEEHNNNKYHNSVNKGQMHVEEKIRFAMLLSQSQQITVWVDGDHTLFMVKKFPLQMCF